MSTKLLETYRGLKETIIEEIVRQVGHLPELYEDARSEKKSKYWCKVASFGYFLICYEFYRAKLLNIRYRILP